MARFGRNKDNDNDVVAGDSTPVEAVPPGTHFAITLPNDLGAGRTEARTLTQDLPELLTGCVVDADGDNSTFLGPMFISELIEQIAVRRQALLVVRGIEAQAGARFTDIAFNLGVTSKVDVAGTVPFKTAIRRAPVEAS